MSMTLYPDFTHGSFITPESYVVYLDFGGCAVLNQSMPTVNEVYRIFQVVASRLAPAGLTVTNKLPYMLRPGSYTTVRMWPYNNLGWRNASGNCPVKQLYNTSWYEPCCVYAGYHEIIDMWAYIAAHEAVHSITGLDTNHENTPVNGYPNLMRDDGSIFGGILSNNYIADIQNTIFKFKAGFRFGFHYVAGTTSGEMKNDWHNIGV